MKAYIFPGQGAQFTGMGKNLYENSPLAKELFEQANEILGFRITDVMFEGSAEELKETKVTQPAVFLHSVILAKVLEIKPDMVAGHSLGEFSALVVNGTLSFEDGLKLVSQRAMAMQKACEITPSTMAAVLNLEDKIVEDICGSIDGVVVVLVQVSYAIGVAKPTSINVNTYGTSKVNMTDGEICKIVEGIFDMRPYFIEQRLKLRNPIYSETAAYGHMGSTPETVTKVFNSPDGQSKTVEVELLTWEKLDFVDKVKQAFSL